MQYFKLYLVQMTACNVLNTGMGFVYSGIMTRH